MKQFLKKYWPIILLIIVVFVAGYIIFKGRKNKIEPNEDLIKAKVQIEQLEKEKEELKIHSDSLKRISDSLYVLWQNKQTSATVEVIKQKYDEKRNVIIDANTDEQFSILTEWLSKEDSVRK